MPLVELVLGGPAAGGGFVARDAGGRVLFVRHGAPGERVLAEVTEEHATWGRADAVKILEASPDRVEPPCRFAGAGGCGGCDYQHLSPVAQRALKGQRLTEQLRTIASLERDVEVQPVAAELHGLRTRTRVRFGVDASGGLAMRRHASHELVAVDDCLLLADADAAGTLRAHDWPPGAEVEVVRLAGWRAPTVSVTETSPGGRAGRAVTRVLEGGGSKDRSTHVHGVDYEVAAGVFWQVHVRAPEVLVDEVLHGLALERGDRVLDLYCGAGLFTKAAAIAVGPTGSVLGVDGSSRATADARRNLRDQPWATVVTAKVGSRAVAANATDVTHVVLDPPRRGVDRGVLRALGDVASIRRVVSVSCDPATFARDLRALLDVGFNVTALRAFDLFEMTEHLECVAVLDR